MVLVVSYPHSHLNRSAHASGGSSADDHVNQMKLVPTPARLLKAGDRMVLVQASVPVHTHTSQTKPVAGLQALRVTRISHWTGGVINPLTHSGLILAASLPVTPGDSGNGDGDLDLCAGMVATTTVLESPGNVQQTLLSLPVTVLKLASWSFPREFQESTFIEMAILTGCQVRWLCIF